MASGGKEKKPLTRPEVSTAPTGRSKCVQCKEPIAQGEHRVGMPARHNGLSVTKWLHPTCFASSLKVDLAPTNRASCRGDGTKIEKGEPRLLARYFNCLNEVGSQCIFKPHNAAVLLADLRRAGASVEPAEVTGLKELVGGDRQAVIDALTGVAAEPGRAPSAAKEKESATLEPNTSQKRRAPPQGPPGKRSKKKSAQEPRAEESDEASYEPID
jgi:hypothetical protein